MRQKRKEFSPEETVPFQMDKLCTSKQYIFSNLSHVHGFINHNLLNTII